jgi:CubicO group peptidase (beta-lactamase class C family)
MKAYDMLDDAIAIGLGTYPCIGAAVAWFDGRQRHELFLGVERSDSAHPVGPETSFAYGSFSKVLTAYIVCQLAAEGKLGIDDSLARHLPLAAGSRLATAGVTVRQLLTHTAGVGDQWRFSASHAESLAMAEATPACAPPGTLFSYSNLGYAILGYLIERATGRSWFDNVEQRMLVPLGRERQLTQAPDAEAMSGLGHNLHEAAGLHAPTAPWPFVGPGFAAAGGTLTGTLGAATDLAYLCSTGRLPADDGSGATLLPAAYIDLMTRAAISVPGKGLLASGWACGWATRATASGEDGASVHHMGGTSVLISAVPATGTVLAVLTNSSTGAMFANLVANQLLEGAQPVPPAPPTQRANTRFDRYCGRYRSATLDINVSRGRDGLLMSDPLGGDGKLTLHYLGGSTFEVSLGFLVTDITFIADSASEAILFAHVALRALPRVSDEVPPGSAWLKNQKTNAVEK